MISQSLFQEAAFTTGQRSTKNIGYARSPKKTEGADAETQNFRLTFNHIYYG